MCFAAKLILVFFGRSIEDCETGGYITVYNIPTSDWEIYSLLHTVYERFISRYTIYQAVNCCMK